MFGVVWDYYTSTKSYKSEIKILANPGLAWSGFEQPGLDYNKSWRVGTCWWKFAILKPKNVRTCLAERVTQVLICGLHFNYEHILTKECSLRFQIYVTRK